MKNGLKPVNRVIIEEVDVASMDEITCVSVTDNETFEGVISDNNKISTVSSGSSSDEIVEKSDQDNKKLNINNVPDIAETSSVAKDLVETGVETKFVEINNRHSLTSTGLEIATDERSVGSTSDSFITEMSYSSVEDK